MLQLSDMLLGNLQLRAAYYDHFVAAVEQQKDRYQLLKELLQSGAVSGALAVAEVQQLVCCQVANLERLGAVPPFNWHMPSAVVPAGIVSSQQVQAFLRGSSAQFTLRGFTGIAQAHDAANTLMGVGRGGRAYYSACTTPTTYSVRAEAHGTGRNAYVVITKTRNWYKRSIASKAVYRRELREVMALKR